MLKIAMINTNMTTFEIEPIRIESWFEITYCGGNKVEISTDLDGKQQTLPITRTLVPYKIKRIPGGESFLFVSIQSELPPKISRWSYRDGMPIISERQRKLNLPGMQ